MHTLFYLGIAMVAGLIFSRIVKKVRLPNVTGFLVAGLLIGPCCLKLVPSEALEGLNIITTVALGFIAFSIGGEFRIASIRAIGKNVIIITLFQSLLAAALVDIVLCVCGFNTSESIILGAIATATAPAATLMVVRQYKAKGELTNTLLPVVAMDDAVGLVVFSVSSAVASTLSSGGPVSVYSMAVKPLIEIVLSLVSGSLLGLLISVSMRFFHSRSNKLMICIAGVVLGEAVANQFGLSDLLVCMSVGAVFANLRDDALDVMDLCDGWTPPLFMLFFVISGAELDLAALPTVGVLGLIYIVVRALGKYFGAYLGAVVVKASPNIRRYLGITLLPQAGVAIGMAQMALATMPEFGARIQAVVLAATLIYELVGPVATKIALTKAGEIAPAKA
ncbi:MAG: cation:proton antiporter [Clostridiales bacterium]|mgnify:CR=1 FL=1|nr:cation:proton antiporter [Clostridiales bacterium]MDY2833689.1 cation:proton antiporter [Candidatus Aphodomonas sp.]